MVISPLIITFVLPSLTSSITVLTRIDKTLDKKTVLESVVLLTEDLVTNILCGLAKLESSTFDGSPQRLKQTSPYEVPSFQTH